MRATVPYVEKKFEEFNLQMFEGKLPMIPIELSDAKTFLGLCVYKKRKLPNGKTEAYDFRLRINTRIDMPEDQLEDTIIHEMIHYYIAFHQLEDTSEHGPLFLRMMNTINQRFGRHMQVSHKSTMEEREQLIDKRIHYHVIALVRFNDGRTGFKVLPRVLRSILYYYNNVSIINEVHSVQLFMSNNVFFNRFPNSSALKVHYMEKDTIEQHLEGAEKLLCDGKSIRRSRK